MSEMMVVVPPTLSVTNAEKRYPLQPPPTCSNECEQAVWRALVEVLGEYLSKFRGIYAESPDYALTVNGIRAVVQEMEVRLTNLMRVRNRRIDGL